MFLFQNIFRLVFFCLFVFFLHLIMCVFDAVLHCDHNEVPNFHMSWKLKESRSAPLHCRIFLFSLCRKVQWFLSSDQTTLHSAVLILLPEAAVLWRFFILFFKHLFRNVSDPSSGRLKKYISKRWSKPGRLCAQVKLISNADLNVDLKKKNASKHYILKS